MYLEGVIGKTFWLEFEMPCLASCQSITSTTSIGRHIALYFSEDWHETLAQIRISLLFSSICPRTVRLTFSNLYKPSTCAPFVQYDPQLLYS